MNDGCEANRLKALVAVSLNTQLTLSGDVAHRAQRDRSGP